MTERSQSDQGSLDNYNTEAVAWHIVNNAFKRVITQNKDGSIPLDDRNMIPTPNCFPYEVSDTAATAWKAYDSYPEIFDDVAKNAWGLLDIAREEINRVAQQAWYENGKRPNY